jgi:hypothetical protein
VEHEIKSSSTSEAGQLPADSHDRKQLEMLVMVNVCNACCKLKTKLISGVADQFNIKRLGIHMWFTTPALAAAVMQL